MSGRDPSLQTRRRARQVLLYGVRIAGVTAVAFGFLFVIALLSLYLWLPGVGAHKAALETKLSAALGRPVTVGSLVAQWDGLYPGVQMTSIVLGAVSKQGSEALAPLTLPDVRVSLAWLPLVWGEVRVHHLQLRDADIQLARLADGRLQVRGFRAVTLGERRDAGVSAWLLRQTRISIHAGRVTWTDAVAGEPPLVIDAIDATLHNPGTERHHLDLRARWPAALCGVCSVNIDWLGDPRARVNWNGQLQVNIERLNLAALPAAIRTALPAGIAGELHTKLRTQWQAGWPRAVRGEATVRNFALTNPAGRLPFASAKIDWQGDVDDWNLYLNDSRLGHERQPWIKGAVHVARTRKGGALQVEAMDLGALMAGLHTWPALPMPEWVTALSPRGDIRDLRARVRGALGAPSDYAIEADVRGLGAAPFRQFPGFTGVTGAIAFDRQEGRLELKDFAGTLALPNVFVAPLPVANAKGTVAWTRESDHWRVRGRELQVRNSDGRGTASFEFRQPFDRTQSSWLKLDARGSALDARHAERYYPHNLLSAPVRAWLTKFIVAGKVNNAQVAIEGPLRAFPFTEGNGVFRVTADVRAGVLDYLPSWPRITDAQAQLRFEGPGIEVRGNGRIGALKVSELVTRIPNLRAPAGAEVAIEGRVNGAIAEILTVLRSASDGRWRHLIPAGLVAKGDGELALKLALPVRALAEFELNADYRFADASLSRGAVAASGLHGNLQFTRAGLRSGEVHGHVLGGDTQLRISANPAQIDGVRVTAQGQIGVGAWGQLMPTALARVAQGRAPWWMQLDFDASGNIAQVAATADLQAVALQLPAPLHKPAGTPLRLAVKTHSMTATAHVIDVQLGARSQTRGSARFAFTRNGVVEKRARLGPQAPTEALTPWAFARGRVHLGEGRAALPTAAGLHVSVLWPAIDGDAWRHFLAPLSDAVVSTTPAAGGLDLLQRVSIEIGALDIFARSFGRVAADLNKSAGGWQGIVRGTNASGEIVVTGDMPRTWQLNFERLSIPPVRGHVAPPADVQSLPPRDLPTVFVQSKSLQVGGAQLGRLALWGRPVTGGWRIQHLVLSRPEMNLFVKGDWIISPPNAPPAQKTDLELDFKTDDLGATLRALGIEDQVSRGRADVTGRLSWEGPPAAFSLATLQAALRLNAERGEFLRVKQGAGKLLGLLDVRSITRYINLDFSSAFGKGFVFDKIGGDVNISQGNAFVSQLTVKGPSADLTIDGRAGLVAEDFDLQLGITPLLRGSLALVGGLAGGPVGAGAAILLERLLKKQIAQGTRLVYTVRGPWSAPVIQRVVQEPPRTDP